MGPVHHRTAWYDTTILHSPERISSLDVLEKFLYKFLHVINDSIVRNIEDRGCRIFIHAMMMRDASIPAK